MECVLKTNNLTKRYGNQLALNHLNMTVKKGDIYGFIGINGAGKSTLMKAVAGLIHYDEGDIELFGNRDLMTQRIRTGCMIEQPAVYGNMSAVDNLEVQRRMIGVPNKERIEELLQNVGLYEERNKKVKSFSLGMKQRLSIALALRGTPDFLILDEPINGLDPNGIVEVRDLILKLNKEEQITILISSHILGELYKVATCYGIIKKGEMVEEFTAEELEYRCRRCIKLDVDDAKKAVPVLGKMMSEDQYEILNQHTIRVFDHLDEAAKINHLLVTNDIQVSGLNISGQNLEEYFMELMGGKAYV